MQPSTGKTSQRIGFALPVIGLVAALVLAGSTAARAQINDQYWAGPYWYGVTYSDSSEFGAYTKTIDSGVTSGDVGVQASVQDGGTGQYANAYIGYAPGSPVQGVYAIFVHTVPQGDSDPVNGNTAAEIYIAGMGEVALGPAGSAYSFVNGVPNNKVYQLKKGGVFYESYGSTIDSILATYDSDFYNPSLGQDGWVLVVAPYTIEVDFSQTSGDYWQGDSSASLGASLTGYPIEPPS